MADKTEGGTAATTSIVLARGLEDLERQNPVVEATATPHRTYDGEHVRVRHLAFDRGAVLAEHAAPAPVVIVVVQGRVTFTTEGEAHELRQGAIIHFGAGVAHTVTAHERSRLVLALAG